MKTLRFTFSLGLALSLLFACSDPNRDALEKKSGGPGQQGKTYDPCTTTLVGDKDGFGKGFKDGYALFLPGGTSLPLDWRSNDPSGMDVYPADIDANRNTTHVVRFSISFAPPSGIQSATLHLNTLGIQDGDMQVYGSDTDIKLFIDGQEVPQAFDTIDQFDFIDGKWSDFVSSFDINIPASMLHLLNDGAIELRWEIIQTVPGMQSYDGFAIDYCELKLCSASDNR